MKSVFIHLPATFLDHFQCKLDALTHSEHEQSQEEEEYREDYAINERYFHLYVVFSKCTENERRHRR